MIDRTYNNWFWKRNPVWVKNLSMEILMEEFKPIWRKKREILQCKSHVVVWKRQFRVDTKIQSCGFREWWVGISRYIWTKGTLDTNNIVYCGFATKPRCAHLVANPTIYPFPTLRFGHLYYCSALWASPFFWLASLVGSREFIILCLISKNSEKLHIICINSGKLHIISKKQYKITYN